MAKKEKKKKSNKKLYFITFISTLLITLIIFGTITGIYIEGKELKYKEEFETAVKKEYKNYPDFDEEFFKKDKKDKNNKKDKEKDYLKRANIKTLEGLIQVSKRVNILVIGIDGGRADTIVLASYDPDFGLLDFVTVPRDTYHHVPGYNYPGQKKINAVYGFPKKDGGGRGLKAQVSQVLGVPIHYYVKADYNALAAIVNTVGGVEVDIKFNMNYDDPYCNPPLHIHFNKGVQTLNGQKSIEYLRWRKNNGHGGAGDIPRTQRQMDFLKRIIKKALTSFKYDKIIKSCYDYVETDMPMSEIVYYSSTLIGFDPDKDIESYLMPCNGFFNQLSYVAKNPEEIKEMMTGIYRKGLVQDEPEKEGEESDTKDKDKKDKKDKKDNKKTSKDKNTEKSKKKKTN